jgi:hypothetical protein
VVNGLNGEPFAPYWCPGESDFTLRWNRSFQGERVLEYTVKGKRGDQWIDWASGTNIGHKHIDTFQPVTVQEVTLSVTKSKAVPQIKNFAIFEACE